MLTLCKLQIWWGYDQYNCFYGTKNDLNENNSTIWLKNTLDKVCCSIGHVSLQTARSPQEWPWVNIQPTLKFSWTSNCSVGRTADTLRTTLPWHESGAVDRIIMSDDKLFIIQEELKAQNDSVYVATIEDIPQQIEGLQRFEILRIVMICETMTLISGFCRIRWKSQCYVQLGGNTWALPERWGPTCLRTGPIVILTAINLVLWAKNNPRVTSGLHSGFEHHHDNHYHFLNCIRWITPYGAIWRQVSVLFNIQAWIRETAPTWRTAQNYRYYICVL